jgi:hypothetical protein
MKMNILLTQNSFDKFAGSEVVILELYEYFRSLNHDLTIFTNYVSRKMKNYLEQNGINFKLPSNFECDDNYDIVWIQHNVIPSILLKNLDKNIVIKKLIFHHMSPFEPFEQPILNQLENRVATLILANSEETKMNLIANGLDEDKIKVFGNPGPSKFLMRPKDNYELKNLLLVTNHNCTEIWKAVNKLPKNINVMTIGNNETTDIWNRRLIPEDLNWADAVISIGKTVQYSILANRPVYNYDIHGGAGWLSDSETFLKSKNLNFSGRGFNFKTSDEIFKELITLYPKAQKFASEIKDDEKENYLLESKIKIIIGSVDSWENSRVDFSGQENQLKGWDLTQTLVTREHLHSRRLEERINNLQLELRDILIERDNIYNSKSWKFTKIFRSIKASIPQSEIKQAEIKGSKI